MAGDKLTVSVKSLYKQTTSNSDAHQPFSTIVSALIGALFTGGAPAALSAKLGSFTDIANATFGAPSGYNNFFANENNKPSNNPANKPKAYLNILLFDENFVLDQTNSVVKHACTGASGVLNPISESELPIKKNGYAYIYVSNESTENVDVFFDNLRVEHAHGPLVEETHYYPFGLTMAGISSNAAGSLTNKRKYNGKEEQWQEFSDGSVLEWLDYGARMYDNQTGRWHVIDPLSEKYASFTPYNYRENNPIKYVDVDGRVIGNPNDPDVKAMQAAMSKTLNGRRIWNAMDKSSRTIMIYMHNSSDKFDVVGKSLNTELTYGETMTSTDESSIMSN